MKVAIACDHGGYLLKPVLTDYLEKNKIEYVDFGTDGTQSVDYPDYALPAAECVARGECDFGILICGTGIGMSIAANKVNGHTLRALSRCVQRQGDAQPQRREYDRLRRARDRGGADAGDRGRISARFFRRRQTCCAH